MTELTQLLAELSANERVDLHYVLVAMSRSVKLTERQRSALKMFAEMVR
jgi:hypothetical protein